MVTSRRDVLAQSLVVGSAFFLARQGTAAPRADEVSFDFEKQNPFEWLIILIQAQLAGQHAVVTGDAPQGWLKAHHIDPLLEMIGSQIECASVGSQRSSNLADSEVRTVSTIGHEAMYLIASYRHGLFPISHRNSTRWPLDPNELKEWWDQQRPESTSKTR